MGPPASGRRRWTTAGAVALAVLLSTTAAPSDDALAAEAGGARLLASVSGTSVVGNCIASASVRGRYGITCAGSRYRASFGALLQGSRPPTCWLVDPATADDTPRSGRTPRASTVGAVTGQAPSLRLLAAPASSAEVPWTGPPVAGATAPPTEVPTPSPGPTSPVPVPSAPDVPVPDVPVPDVPVPDVPVPDVPVVAVPPLPVPDVPAPPVPTPEPRPPQEFLQVCLSPPPDPGSGVPSWGTDLERTTVRVSPDDPARYPFWEELTEGQRAYADLADRREGTIQVNGLVVSPSTTPRIGQTIAFSVRNDVPPPVVARGDTMMRAVPVDLTVWPYPGADPVSCSGTGRDVAAGSIERTGPDVCSYTYRRTSAGAVAGRARDTFAVTGTSRWQIQISHDRGATWSDHLLASVPADLGLQVREVQTLVVPLTAP